MFRVLARTAPTLRTAVVARAFASQVRKRIECDGLDVPARGGGDEAYAGCGEELRRR